MDALSENRILPLGGRDMIQKKTKRFLSIFITLIIVVICIFLLLQSFSFQLALGIKGYETETAVFFHGFDSQQREYQVIQTENREGSPCILLLTKNSLGFWQITPIQMDKNEASEIISCQWEGKTKVRRFSPYENGVFETEFHQVYYGSNALSKVYFLPGQLPADAAVSIQQNGREFWIHTIAFHPDGEIVKEDILTFLQKNGCVA